MPIPDQLDFDSERLAMYEEGRVREALTEHPSLYINHLEIAQHLSGWAERLEEDARPALDPEFTKGYVEALREVAAHLRQADYAPGGGFLRERGFLREQREGTQRGH